MRGLLFAVASFALVSIRAMAEHHGLIPVRSLTSTSLAMQEPCDHNPEAASEAKREIVFRSIPRPAR